MRVMVLIGPFGAHFRLAQYASYAANVVSSRSTSHFVALTYPYRPGTSMRTGKPCSSGRGWPFIPIASIASRPSITTDTGEPAVQPSDERLTNWSEPAATPASASRSRSGTPIQRAEPAYWPPTSLDTQVRVMSRSIIGRARRSAKLRRSSRSTMPCTRSCQSAVLSFGTMRAVSTR